MIMLSQQPHLISEYAHCILFILLDCTVLYLFARRSVLICHHVLAVTNYLLLTLYGGPAAAVR